MNKKFSPAVSVIVPVFNEEKYLPVCLESILIQTLTDFEVIVVDDGSTDQSLIVAESFLERFGGRLKVVTLAENTGSGAVPRNVGLDLSCGKYVFFADADDLVVDNALETFYTFAETFGAQVVYPDCGFTCGEEIIPPELDVAVWDANNIVEEPTFEPEDFSRRVENFLSLRYKWPPWAKFIRRDLLVDNEIKFPRMRISEDVIWTFELVCLAKKFLRVPTSLYVQRKHQTSMTRRKRSPEDEIIFWTNPLIDGVDILNEFMSRFKFFDENPSLRLQVLNLFATIHFTHMTEAFKAMDTAAVYEVFLREFSKSGGDRSALISYLLVMNNLYRNELMT